MQTDNLLKIDINVIWRIIRIDIWIVNTVAPIGIRISPNFVLLT